MTERTSAQLARRVGALLDADHALAATAVDDHAVPWESQWNDKKRDHEQAGAIGPLLAEVVEAALMRDANGTYGNEYVKAIDRIDDALTALQKALAPQ